MADPDVPESRLSRAAALAVEPEPVDPSRWTDERAAERTLRRLASTPEVPWLHGEVARRMAERLSIVKRQPATIIDWWGDVGGGIDALRQAYPRARLRQVTAGARVRDARRWPWSRGVPRLEVSAVQEGEAALIWSNMSMHFSQDRAALPAAWSRALGVDGFLMFSTFGPDTLRELRKLYAGAGWGPAQAPFEDMHDIGDRLVASGLADPVMDQEQVTLTYASAEALLADLRSLGANLHVGRHRGLRTPRWRRRWLEAVGATAQADGRIAATFEIAYGHAFKPAPRDRSGSRSIGLERMREMLSASRPHPRRGRL